ncbi:hypothetical protein [Alteribacillus iranensis]|uniref:Uncharacterized protein n=1 Tax=Alteribacillus iranensis TaxID=930128 RepID=A0A1I2B9B9_9BACI|nr:hypothetical protein [Alteribacillus iranensis]SFE51913.1 hypothetical protein SAMN05192532_102123 [Alteribacillus iranensis]
MTEKKTEDTMVGEEAEQEEESLGATTDDNSTRRPDNDHVPIIPRNFSDYDEAGAIKIPADTKKMLVTWNSK